MLTAPDYPTTGFVPTLAERLGTPRRVVAEPLSEDSVLTGGKGNNTTPQTRVNILLQVFFKSP